jgi:hypothetical protein
MSVLAVIRFVKVAVLGSKFLKGKLTLASVAPLVVNVVASALGYDIAPTTVDIIIAFLSTVGVAVGRARAVYQALRATPKVAE